MLFQSCLKKAHSSVPRHHLSLAVLLQRETDFLLVFSVRIGDLILLPYSNLCTVFYRLSIVSYRLIGIFKLVSRCFLGPQKN